MAADLLSQAEHGTDSQVVLVAINLTDKQLDVIQVHETVLILGNREKGMKDLEAQPVKLLLPSISTRTTSLTIAVSDFKMCAWARIPHVLRPKGIVVVLGLISVFLSEGTRGDSRGLFSEVVSPPLSLLLSSLFYQCEGCLFFSLLCGGSWLGFPDCPAMGAVSIKQLSAKSGTSTLCLKAVVK